MKHQPIMEQDERAKAAVDRWGELKSERSSSERDWETIAKLFRPQRGGFGLSDPASRELVKPLSSAPIIAQGNFAAGIYAGITNPATRWGGLTTPDEDLNKWPPFADWLDRQTRKVHNSFSPSMSSFYPATYQAYGDLACFGNAAGYDELERDTRRFIDVTVSLADVVVDIDYFGRVVEAVRRMRLTARQAAGFFGKDALPEAIQKQLEKGGTDKQVYYQHVLRNDNFASGGLGPRGKRWLSRHVCEEKNTLLRESGYDQMPFYYPRWDVDTGMTYGTGVGYVALASARTNHNMEDATIRAAQWAADPARLLPDRNVAPLEGTWRPGGAIYGAMRNGQQQVGTLDFVRNIGLTQEEKRAKVEEVKEAFYYSVMSLTGRTGISDEENAVIEEARLRNWAPHADRVMEEYAARKFERRYMMLFKAGQIDPVPEGTPSDAKLQIRYQSAAALALRASEATAVRRYMADLAPMMEIKPELRHRISAHDYAEILHEASPTLPQRLLVSREQAQQSYDAELQAQQAQQMAELAKTGGAGARDIAQAVTAGQGGGQEGGG